MNNSIRWTINRDSAAVLMALTRKTIADVARAAGFSYQVAQVRLVGRCTVDTETLKKIAEELETEPAALVCEPTVAWKDAEKVRAILAALEEEQTP